MFMYVIQEQYVIQSPSLTKLHAYIVIQVYTCTFMCVFSCEMIITGADPGFSFREGAKDYVPARTLPVQNQTHFRQGSRARLRALEALGLF